MTLDERRAEHDEHWATARTAWRVNLGFVPILLAIAAYRIVEHDGKLLTGMLVGVAVGCVVSVFVSRRWERQAWERIRWEHTMEQLMED